LSQAEFEPITSLMKKKASINNINSNVKQRLLLLLLIFNLTYAQGQINQTMKKNQTIEHCRALFASNN
jgi:hypothetical protein